MRAFTDIHLVEKVSVLTAIIFKLNIISTSKNKRGEKRLNLVANRKSFLIKIKISLKSKY
jgi:hypothetical protein